MKFALYFLPLCFAIALASQDKPAAPAKPAVPPTISAEHRATYFKMQLRFKEATMAYQQAQGALQAAVADLTKDCGDKFRPQMNNDGDPTCVAIPAPAPEPAKK